MLVREVFDAAQRDALVETVAGSLIGAVREPVLSRVFDYWTSIDRDTGRRIREKVLGGVAEKPVPGMAEA